MVMFAMYLIQVLTCRLFRLLYAADAINLFVYAHWNIGFNI